MRIFRRIITDKHAREWRIKATHDPEAQTIHIEAAAIGAEARAAASFKLPPLAARVLRAARKHR